MEEKKEWTTYFFPPQSWSYQEGEPSCVNGINYRRYRVTVEVLP